MGSTKDNDKVVRVIATKTLMNQYSMGRMGIFGIEGNGMVAWGVLGMRDLTQLNWTQPDSTGLLM